MKILVKNLKQVQYPVELDNAQITVQALKLIIQKVHNLEENSLKLIFNGVVLEDSKLLSDYKIQDGSILIMMLSKIKPIHMNQSQPIPNPQPSTEDKKEKEEEKQKEIKPKVNKPKKETKQEPEKDYTNEVKPLVEMGFEKEQALLAIKAAKGNIQLAVEYLYNGLPIEATQEEEEMEEEEEPQITEKDELKAAASVVKILYAQDPTSLEDLIMNLEESDPSLMKLIKDHEEEFQNLINEPINDEDLRNFDEFQKQLGGESQMGTPSHSEEYSTIQITPEEAAAIQRLINLCGLSEAEVTQAYFACDKNEELTANFLLESKYNNPQNNNGNNNQGGNHQ